MKRTQVYFPEKTLELLKNEAREKNTTMAAVVREKVEKNLQKPSREEVAKRLKAVEKLSRIGLPTVPQQRMKKILSETHVRAYDLLSRH